MFFICWITSLFFSQQKESPSHHIHFTSFTLPLSSNPIPSPPPSILPRASSYFLYFYHISLRDFFHFPFFFSFSPLCLPCLCNMLSCKSLGIYMNARVIMCWWSMHVRKYDRFYVRFFLAPSLLFFHSSSIKSRMKGVQSALFFIPSLSPHNLLSTYTHTFFFISFLRHVDDLFARKKKEMNE